jgi:hypothetical protein
MDGSGDLEDLGVEDDAGIASGGGGTDNMGAHGAAGSGQIYVFVTDDDHVFLGDCWWRLHCSLLPYIG